MDTTIAIAKHLLGSLAIAYLITQVILMLAVGARFAASRTDTIRFAKYVPALGLAVAIAMWVFG